MNYFCFSSLICSKPWLLKFPLLQIKNVAILLVFENIGILNRTVLKQFWIYIFDRTCSNIRFIDERSTDMVFRRIHSLSIE